MIHKLVDVIEAGKVDGKRKEGSKCLMKIEPNTVFEIRNNNMGGLEKPLLRICTTKLVLGLINGDKTPMSPANSFPSILTTIPYLPDIQQIITALFIYHLRSPKETSSFQLCYASNAMFFWKVLPCVRVLSQRWSPPCTTTSLPWVNRLEKQTTIADFVQYFHFVGEATCSKKLQKKTACCCSSQLGPHATTITATTCNLGEASC